MAWVKVDTRFPTHFKTLDIGIVAEGLWLRGLCYAGEYLTDGRIPLSFIARMRDMDGFTAANELVRAGLWIDAGTGWIIDDSDGLWQPSSDQSERSTGKYSQWRKEVLDRDGWTCQDCSLDDGEMHAHHIKPWATHPALRFDIDNGITLCPTCHRDRHRKGGV